MGHYDHVLFMKENTERISAVNITFIAKKEIIVFMVGRSSMQTAQCRADWQNFVPARKI